VNHAAARSGELKFWHRLKPDRGKARDGPHYQGKR
jgi:hypothetical protein